MKDYTRNHEGQSSVPQSAKPQKPFTSSQNRWLGRSSLVEKLGTSNFLVIGHICPPGGSDLSRLIEHYASLRNYIDAVQVADNPRATPVMAGLATAALLESNGIPTILTMTCRDRNIIALQSDILGAAALGIQGVFCITGDCRALGDHPEAKPVYEVDALQLIALARQLRDEGVFASGRRLESLPTYLIGAAGSLFKEPLAEQVDRTAAKIALGADFILTPPLFDLKLFRDFAARLRSTGALEHARLIAGIPIITSHKDGVAFAASLIEQVREIPGCSGVVLMPSDLYAVDTVRRLIEMTDLRPPQPPLKVNICTRAAV